jgi:hypothetical protein
LPNKIRGGLAPDAVQQFTQNSDGRRVGAARHGPKIELQKIKIHGRHLVPTTENARLLRAFIGIAIFVQPRTPLPCGLATPGTANTGAATAGANEQSEK